MTQGSTLGRYLPISRRVRPQVQTASPPTAHDRGDGQPDRIVDAGHRLAEVLVERQVEHPSGSLRAAPRVSSRNVATIRTPVTPAASDERTSAADREPDPGERRGSQAEDADPEDGVDDVAALDDDRDPDDRRDDEGHDRDRAQDPGAAAERPAARDRGVESTTSSRRRPSSLAQPARNDAPASPMMNEPNPKNVSWRTADGWWRSTPGRSS